MRGLLDHHEAPSPASATAPHDGVLGGARIANARGITGTLGFPALTLHDDRLVVVGSHHVLFGDRGREDEPIWLLDGFERGVAPMLLGRTRYGKRGTVRYNGVDAHVDCAVADVDSRVMGAQGWRVVEDDTPQTATPLAGERVTKRGSGTASTEGTLVDTSYRDRLHESGYGAEAPHQLLIRPDARAAPFSGRGDSGAAVRNADGDIVGLLWGVNAFAESVACPIAHVLYVLNIRIARLERVGGAASHVRRIS